MISKRSFVAYSKAVDTAADLCERKTQALWNKVLSEAGGDGAVVRNAMIAALPALVATYCDQAAEAAASYYERERGAEWGGTFNARLAKVLPDRQIEKNIRYCMQYYFDGTPERSIIELRKTMRMHVQNAARNTMMENMWRDDG